MRLARWPRWASAPRSATTFVRSSPFGATAQDPMISPSHQRVGPMLPARSNTRLESMPRNQSRFFHPMGVGSSAGSSVAAGSPADSSATPSEIDPGLSVQVDLLDLEPFEGATGCRGVPSGPPPQVLGRRRAEASQPATSEIALRLGRVDRRQALRPPSRDRFPAMVTTGPAARSAWRGRVDRPRSST